MEKKAFSEEIELPTGVEAKIDHGTVLLKGPKGENRKQLRHKKVNIKTEDKKIVLTTKKANKTQKKIMRTFAAHIKNMIKGVTEGHVYKMRICSGHFPMNVSIDKDKLVIKNFFGEKHPREVKIREGVKITISGNDLVLEGTNKEAVSQMTAAIEEKTKRSGYDRRVFQDGIFIFMKDGKQIK